MKQLNNTAIYSFKVELFAVCYLNAALETLQSIFAGRLTALFFYSNDGEMNLTGNVSCHMRGSEYECLLPCLGIISWAIFLSGPLSFENVSSFISLFPSHHCKYYLFTFITSTHCTLQMWKDLCHTKTLRSCSPLVLHSSVLKASNWYSGRSRVRLVIKLWPKK